MDSAAARDQLSTSLRAASATDVLAALRPDEEDGPSMDRAVLASRRSLFGGGHSKSGSLQELLAKSLLAAAADDNGDDDEKHDEELLLVSSPDLAAFLQMGSQRPTRIVCSRSALHHVSDEEDDDEAASTPIVTPSSRRRSPSSFTRAHRLVPCSPPILIPQNSLSWRSSDTQTSSSGTGANGAIGGGGSRDPVTTPIATDYSRTQQEAQLWDEYWHYKLSLEARESFENSTTRENGDQQSTAKAAARKAQSIASMTSTEDTTREDEWTTMSDEDEDCHVFAMDDL